MLQGVPWWQSQRLVGHEDCKKALHTSTRESVIFCQMKQLKLQVEQLQHEVVQLQGQLESETQDKSAILPTQAAAMVPSTSSVRLQ